MQAPLVVTVDPVLDIAAGSGTVGPGRDPDFAFDGGEEGLGRSAVQARSSKAGTLSDLQTPQRIAIGS
jgi:hypothetical protein